MAASRLPHRAALLLSIALLLGCPQELCPTGETRCGGTCTDTLTDGSHCGGCDQPCGLGTCTAGTCACDTAAGATECAGMWPRCADLASDPAHCGACGASCVASTGATCSAGACACPPAAPNLCGTNPKSCCETSTCCGEACQTKHSNGLGNSFFDCSPPGTYSYSSALAAADAWGPGTSFDQYQLACTGCYGRQSATACAVWCYSGSPVSGRVHLNDVGSNACLCPSTLDGTWN